MYALQASWLTFSHISSLWPNPAYSTRKHALFGNAAQLPAHTTTRKHAGTCHSCLTRKILATSGAQVNFSVSTCVTSSHGYQKTVYTVSEDAGTVEVCAIILPSGSCPYTPALCGYISNSVDISIHVDQVL